MRLFRHRQEPDRDLGPESRSLLTILIREIQDMTQSPYKDDWTIRTINSLLQTWITANKLHPEKVTKTEAGLYSYQVS